ncbi:MAG TPA: hypothetical protein VLG14_11245 [Sphingomonas sp.]|jgi:hypothetical protein|nr:hypothetical protein [Sphingomonas sp.]
MISVGRILEGAFGVFREHFTAVAIWAGIYLACNIAAVLAVQSFIGGVANAADGTDPAAAVSALWPVWLIGFITAIIGVVLYTAAMRSVLRPDARGIAFLRLGLDELRTLGLVILFFIAGFVLFFGASLVIGLFVGGVAAGSESVALTAVLSFLVGLVVFGALLFLVVRLSLAFPLTLHRRAFALGEAWRLSRGHFWKLFGAALVITLIGFVLSIVVNLVVAGSYFADVIAAMGDPEASALIAERQAEDLTSFSTVMLLRSVGGAALAGIWIALSGGSIASAARLLVNEEFDDAEDVFG